MAESCYPKFEIPQRLIKLFTYIGETVLDPFLGSGTSEMDMLLYIKCCDVATIVQIQSYMLTAHGLKFKSTANYIKECQFAGILRTDGMLFRVVEKKVKFEADY
jgi:hypothetical protein